MTAELEVEVTIGAPPETVWRALTDDAERKQWWSYLELDARPGGALVEIWTDGSGGEQRTSGEVLAAEPGRLLRLSWRDDGWPAETIVELTFDAVSEGTRVVLRHSGWDRLPAGGELAAAHRGGWGMHLANLREHAERGAATAA